MSTQAIPWKLIDALTDKTVLGTDGFSDAAPRKKSRAILIAPNGKIAVMYEKATQLHALPGGGIEPGEDETSALYREVAEETGCTCDLVQPVGIVSENRGHAGTTHLSYFFVVHTKTVQSNGHLTEEEIALGTELKWCSPEEALVLIQSNVTDTNQKKFLQARDLSALREFLKFNVR